MIKVFFLPNPPLEIKESVEKEAKRVEEHQGSKKLRLSDDQLQAIEKDLAKKYKSWKEQTSPLRRRIAKLNDILEGVVEQTNFPFEGASNMTLHYPSAMLAAFRSNFSKVAFQNPNIIGAQLQDGSSNDDMEKLEDALNYSFNTETNGLTEMEKGLRPCFRDGTMILSGCWDRRVEKVGDSKTYIQDIDFIADYPDSDSAGVTVDEYNKILDAFLESTQEDPVEVKISFDYDMVKHDGPEYEIIPLARFVYWPIYPTKIRDMQLYGRHYTIPESEVTLRKKKRLYYDRKADELLAKGRGMVKDRYSASKDFIEGLMQKNTDENRRYVLADLVYKYDLDKDGVQEKYLVTFSPEHEVVLSMERYDIRRNIDKCVAFRFESREDRFLGVSLLNDTEDLFMLMDDIHRHRNNVRSLTTAPILLAPKKQKEDLDLGMTDSLIRPGTTFWVDDTKNSISQLALTNLDQPGNSLDEENIITRYIELRLGPTQGLSGQDSPTDPDAPASKTLALLSQAGQRIEDYINEFFKSIPDIAELHCALMFQYGASGDRKYTINKDGKPTQITVSQKLLSALNTRFYYKKRSVTMSPEFSMARIQGITQFYASLLPLLQQGDPTATELWNRFVKTSGEPDVDKFIVTEEMMAQKQQLAAQQAQLQQVLALSGKGNKNGNR